MKNILVLTSVYPADDLPKRTTPVVHYFAKEWIKQGYRVKVVNNLRYFPRLAFWTIRIFKKLISKYYKFIFRTKGITEAKHYVLDQVEVYRMPIFKIFPLSLYSKREQRKQLNKIKNILNSERYVPDIIIGHWANPQLNQVIELKKCYKAKTCIVMHSDVSIIKRMYGKRSKEAIDNIDIWGFRSNKIKRNFEYLYGEVNRSFLCYSGIPENNLDLAQRSFKNGIKNFVFVGVLIPRKHPEVILKAVSSALKEKDFRITFIGTGPEKSRIEKSAQELNISEKVLMLGRVPREQVLKIMKNSDCFIMLSKPETFGLVYLEAMSVGCITIGSKGEGIDGIIKHGNNGFLSEAGNHKKLANLLRYISALPEETLTNISKNAIKTASSLTDKEVAKKYIEAVEAAKSIQEDGAPVRF